MSGSASSLLDATVDQFPGTAGELEAVPADLLVALRAVADLRARRGVRHRFTAIVGIGVCAVAVGARSFTAIAEWATDLTPTVRLRLGLGRRSPSESTIRRVLQRVDAEALDAAISSWLAARSSPVPLRCV